MPQIRTYCRIKPTADYYPEFEVTSDILSLQVPELLRDYNNPKANNRTKIHHEFHFNYIFKNIATQEEVFNTAAKDIVTGFLDGYNGTIFAYGQTGTGKTFTVEGYSKQYNMRGLEPRALSMIFQQLEKRTDEEINVHISYMEIYQEVGFDLLNPNTKQVTPNTPFPRVHVLESSRGVWVVRNLSVHQVTSEEVALNLLSKGQTNRKVAATNVHDRSSRSHAVFTVQLTAKKPGSDTITRSKLHLVDLAGSERVSKTGVQGHQLNEAKCINLSLHYLETVIISLQGGGAPASRQRPNSSGNNRRQGNSLQNRPATAEGTRAGNISKHVPYRNSLLTMVLRDSLGGNCMTAMIATISLEFENIGESISTCRFAGRVACIANTVSGRIWRNEQLDEKSLIKKLKKKVAELETELACLKLAKEVGNAALDGMNTKLTDEDKIMCAEIIQGYVGGKVPDPITAGITNPQKFRECMKLLKSMIKEGQHLNAELDDGRAVENGKTNQNWRLTDNHLNKKNIRTIVHNPAHSRRKAVQVNNKNVLSSNDNPDVDILKVNHDVKYQQTEKEVEIPITNAWTADTREPSKPVKRKPHPVQEKVEEPLPEDPIKRLAALLETHKRRSRKYQSPFEKKRVKEIKTLNTKVEQLQQEKQEKEEELLEMKLSLATQELDIMEQELKTNLEVTKDQISDQHAYIQQLKSTEADPNLVEQEKLVEKQLKKRQAKFDKKLEIVEEKRHHLNEQSEQIKTEIGSAKPTLVDKFGKYRKHDGTLNTRQVYDMLRNEEKKQERVQTELDRERYMIISRQLEMKELATRQKLQEFKEMLRMSKSAGYPEGLVLHGGDRNMNTAPAKSSFVHREPSRHASTRHTTRPVQIVEQDEDDNRASAQTRGSQDTFFTAKTDFDRDDEDQREEYPKSAVTRVSGATFFTAKSNFDRPPSRASMRSYGSSIPDSEFYAKRKQEKDPTVRWESAFSRPPSSAASRPASVADFHNDLKKNSDKEVQFMPAEYMTDDYKSNSRKTERKRDISSDRENLQNGFDSDPDETMLPSNYVYGMGRGEKFDARKMGLASTSFDTALASMLEKSNDNVYYDHEDYNEFARNTNPSFYGEVPNSRKSRERSRQRTSQTNTYGRPSRSKDRWGQDYHWMRENSRSRDRKSTSRDRNRRSRDRKRDPSIDSDYSDSERKAPPKQKTPNVKFRNWGPMARETSILDRLAATSVKTPEKKSRQERPKKDSSFNDVLVGHTMKMEYVPKKTGHFVATTSNAKHSTAPDPEDQVENVFQTKVQSHKERVAKIRKARRSAELIQRAWRNYVKKRNRR